MWLSRVLPTMCNGGVMDSRLIRVGRMLVRGPREWVPVPVVLSLVVCCAAAAGSATPVAGRGAATGGERPELQRMLDGLVTGPRRIAPGVTAYCVGTARNVDGSRRGREREHR